MPALTMKTDWVISFSTPELRLVLKALGGRLKPEDIEEAKNLGDRLSLMKAHTTLHNMREADKLLSNLEEASRG